MATLNRLHQSLINPLEYGASCNSTTLSATLSVIGSTRAALMLTATDRAGSASSWSITGNVTIPANVTLWVAAGASLSVATGVTVTIAGAVEAPLNQWITLTGTGKVILSGTIDVYGEWWGAVGDGTSNDAGPLQKAVDALVPNGGTLRLLGKTYAVATNIFVQGSHIAVVGIGESSVIKAISGVTASIGALAFGITPAFGPVAVTAVRATDLKVDGNALCRGLYINATTRGRFERVWSGNSTAGALQMYSSVDCAIVHCHAENGNGTFGDGIYCESCTRPRILFNRVYDFERIGIVCEGSPGANTVDAYIHGNDIAYGHNATNPESNSGIWVENCEQAFITENRISNMTNTPGLASRGITLGSVVPVGIPKFVVTGNRIEDAQIAIACSPGVTSRVIVSHNLLGGTGMLIGVHVSLLQTLLIDACTFGPSTHTAGSHGAIVLDTTNTIARIDITNCTVIGSTYSGDSADVNIYSLSGGTLAYLRLAGLFQWRCIMRAAPYHTVVSDCELSHNTTNYWGVGATNYCEAINSSCVDSGSAGVRGLGSAGHTGVYAITNCTFTSLITHLASSTNVVYRFVGCRFYGAQISFDGDGELDFVGCLVDQFPSTGFVRGNYSTGATFHIRFRSGEIRSANDYVPFGLWNYHPTTLIIQDTVYSNVITVLSSMTAASTGFFVTNVNPNIVATANLPAAGAPPVGQILIEDGGAGDRNLIIYAGGERFRIDGGAAF